MLQFLEVLILGKAIKILTRIPSWTVLFGKMLQFLEMLILGKTMKILTRIPSPLIKEVFLDGFLYFMFVRDRVQLGSTANNNNTHEWGQVTCCKDLL